MGEGLQRKQPEICLYFFQTLPVGVGCWRLTQLNRNHLHSLKVSVLSPGAQSGSSCRFGSLDGLIEINRRRIEIFEETAACCTGMVRELRYPDTRRTTRRPELDPSQRDEVQSFNEAVDFVVALLSNLVIGARQDFQ